MRVPSRRSRQWLRLIVVTKGRETAPRHVTAAQLHKARGKHQTEQEPPKEPNDDWGRICLGTHSRPPLNWRQKDRQKPRFEQQHVPLVTQEKSANVKEREIEQPKQDQ